MLTVLRHEQRDYWRSECRLATGRSCLAHLINVAGFASALMPAYVPEGVLEPFKRADVAVHFYPLKDGLVPDVQSIAAQLGDLSDDPVAIIAIHYFGFHVDFSELRALTDDRMNVVLVEDCAQALFEQGIYGDVALWSYNKFLPVTDGALMLSNRYDIDVTTPTIEPPPQETIDNYREHLKYNAVLARLENIIDDEAHPLFELSREHYDRYYASIRDCTPYAQSNESKCIVDRTAPTRIRDPRHYNAMQLFKVIPKSFFWKMPHPLDAPFAYPIIVPEPLTRIEVIAALQRVNVIPAMQVEKWHHLPCDRLFPVEMNFMLNHLLLPVHEGVTMIDIASIGGCLQGLIT